MTTCVDLTTKGLLTRRLASKHEMRLCNRSPYLDAPAIAEVPLESIGTGKRERFIVAFPIGASVSSAPPPIADGVPPERAEKAERAARLWAGKLRQAERRIEALEHQLHEAERRARTAERRSVVLECELSRIRVPAEEWKPPSEIIVELSAPSGICRVCGAPAPPPHAARKDNLRVCTAAICHREARRRDNNAKQQRYHARQRAKREDVRS